MLRRPLSRTPAVLAGILLAAGVAAAPPAEASSFTLHLVPEARWKPEEIGPEDFLPEGRVYLYRQGDPEPALILPLNRPSELPGGDWRWIAEAPGFVTVAGGWIRTGDQGPPKTLVWPAAPACRVEVAGSWPRGIRRLDLVSLNRGSVYPRVAGRPATLQVPAGSFLAYSVNDRGLVGISRPMRCPKGETVFVPVPSAPPPDRQQLMVPVRLPEEAGHLDLEAALGAPGPAPPARPDAASWNRLQGTLFYLDLPARSGELLLEHPDLRSRSIPVPESPGEAVELSAVELRPRPILELDVDYRPLRAHRQAGIQLLHCGLRPLQGLPDEGDCRPAAASQPLVEGLHGYRFPSLDGGQYRIDAVVDDERVAGLGNQVHPYLGPDDDAFPARDPALLWELEIWGEIRQDGEPVDGLVRLDRRDGSGGFRVFPTDETGTYRLYYFGTVADRFDLDTAGLPLEELERPADERLGWYGMGVLQVCSEDGFCRSFHPKSVLIGSGRLDFELGTERSLEVRVVDDETRLPVAGAFVGVRPAAPALRFRDGEVWFDEAPDASVGGSYTDARGLVRLRGLGADTVKLGVRADGFRIQQETVRVPPGAALTHEIRLSPDRNRSGGRLVLEDGTPLAGAAVLVFTDDGRWERSCSSYADGRGQVRLADRCREDRRIVALHPAAALTVLPVDVLDAAEARLPPAPLHPPVLQLADAEGRPVADHPVVLAVDGLVLSPDAFVFAAYRHSRLNLPRTGADGRVPLQGVDPSGWAPLTAWPLGWPEAAVELGRSRPGEEVRVTVETVEH